MSKKEKGRGRFRRQFRKANDKKNKKHPAYLYEKVGTEYRFVGITHSEITNATKNIKLDKNPDPNDKRVAYIRPTPDKANRSIFGKRLEHWKLSEKDIDKVEQVIKKDKNKK